MAKLNSSAPTTSEIVGGVASASAPAPAEGQGVALSFDLNGNLRVTTGGSGVTSNVNIADVNGNPPALTNPLPVELSDGTNAMGTNANPIRTSPSTTAIGQPVVGNAGASFDGPIGSAIPANALLKGLRAATAYPTAVTDGQMAAAMGDKAGRQIAVLNGPRDIIATAVLSSSSASLTSFIASGGANIFTDIITFIATNESSTATIVTLSDGTNSYKYALAANGGIVINFPTPKPAASAATAWQVSNSAAVAVDYEALYVKNK